MSAYNAMSEQMPYREVSLKPVILVLILLVTAVALPLGWFIYSGLESGVRSSDVSKYSMLADQVKVKVDEIENLLKNDKVDEFMLVQVSSAPDVTLILPGLVPTNGDPAVSEPGTLDVKLKAIYWNPVDPLITVGNENYRVGEKINGFKIVQIRKTAVVFESPLGDQVTKYFYEYLRESERR